MSDVRRWAELMRFSDDLEFDSEVLKVCAENYKRPSVRMLLRTIEKYGTIM